MKTVLFIGSISIAAATLAFLRGPKINRSITPSYPTIPKINLIEEYLAQSEASHSDIIEGAEKKIIWAGKEGEKSKYSIIYLHGFSASRQEISPVPEEVAKSLGANIFLTRIAGHGRGFEGMYDATYKGYLTTALEAQAIGEVLGDSVIIMAHSTGSPLALWLASQNSSIKALLLSSTNLKLANRASTLLTLPWGEQIGNLLLGKTAHFTPHNELHKKFWTAEYPTRSLLTMLAVSALGREIKPQSMRVPLLSLYTKRDSVISIKALKKHFKLYGSSQKKLVHLSCAKGHDIAGYINAPQCTAPMIEEMLSFLNDIGIGGKK